MERGKLKERWDGACNVTAAHPNGCVMLMAG